MLTKRVQVSPERVTQQLRNLRDDRDVCPQSGQVDLARRNTIIGYVSLREDASEQRKGQRTLSTPSAADDTDTFTRLDMKVDTMEDFGTIGAVLGRQVLNNEFSAGRPIGRRDALRCWLRFLLDVRVLLDSLQTTDV